MDPRVFDMLSRAVGTAATRRTALTGLAGAFTALVSRLAPDGAADAAARPTRVCRPRGSRCFPGHGVDCCSGTTCRNGRCRVQKPRRCKPTKNRCCRTKDCPTNQVCAKRRCQCRPGQKPCGNRCINDQACCTNRDCDAGQRCEQDTCVTGVTKPCGEGGPCRVFATSDVFGFNLGGVEGADQKCQAAADASPRTQGATYKAWISGIDPASAPATRFTNLGKTGRYVLVNDAATLVASDWADLTTDKAGNYLRSPINVSEHGEPLGDGWAWTNVTTAGGQISDQLAESCGNWAESQFMTYGFYGEIYDQGEDWTDLNFTIDCTSNDFHLYCFEQG